MDWPAAALFLGNDFEPSMPLWHKEEMRCCTGAPYMNCIGLAFDSLLLRALRRQDARLNDRAYVKVGLHSL